MQWRTGPLPEFLRNARMTHYLQCLESASGKLRCLTLEVLWSAPCRPSVVLGHVIGPTWKMEQQTPWMHAFGQSKKHSWHLHHTWFCDFVTSLNPFWAVQNSILCCKKWSGLVKQRLLPEPVTRADVRVSVCLGQVPPHEKFPFWGHEDIGKYGGFHGGNVMIINVSSEIFMTMLGI